MGYGKNKVFDNWFLVQRDADRLNVDYSVKTNGLVELSDLANETINNLEKWSLNGLLMNQVGWLP